MPNDNTIEGYFAHTCIEQEGGWGSHIEMAVLAHKLDVNIASFNVDCGFYCLWSHCLLHPNDYISLKIK